MINVLVVGDSPSKRDFLLRILASDPDVRVIATASSGKEALQQVQRQRPDVITMDSHLPNLNGLEATRLIMESHPVPIIIVTDSGSPGEVATTFDAVDAGAVAVLPFPPDVGATGHVAAVQELLRTVKVMSEVKVVRRWPRAQRGELRPRPAERGPVLEPARLRVVAIGASTGGPLALATLLGGLSKGFPVPILVVQHMASGFMRGFVDWLAPSSALPVHIATDGERLFPGHVYMAPEDVQMKVNRQERIVLMDAPAENGLRPSVSCLFRSVCDTYGCEAAAVLLTGMGRDGAQELRLLKEKGAITFAQDKESSVVYGMPGEAIRLDAAMLVLPPEKIAATLMNMANAHNEIKGLV